MSGCAWVSRGAGTRIFIKADCKHRQHGLPVFTRRVHLGNWAGGEGTGFAGRSGAGVLRAGGGYPRAQNWAKAPTILPRAGKMCRLQLLKTLRAAADLHKMSRRAQDS